VAIGRYDRTDDPSVAEVAFVVTDDYQHRGLGAVLLTQLAERAHQVGIVRFCAETLAENRAMLNVFRDSGYPMTATNCCGVVEVTLALSRARPGWRRP
jgi:GNAT superfamily N-acetyltransferase